MAWTEKMVLEFQEKNNKMLNEINQSLHPPSGIKTGKIGIFLFGQAGDLATATGVLKYINRIFPNKEIIWYCNHPNSDLLKYSTVSEVRAWLWAGNGLPAGCPDYYPMLSDSNNKLNKELASNFVGTADLEDGYFPAPHMIITDKQNGINYTDCSKMIFNIPKEWEWHPLFWWIDEEEEIIKELMSKLPNKRKNILLETFAGSGQSNYWDENFTKKIMAECRKKLGNCNFIFGSHAHKGGIDNIGVPNSIFFDDAGCISCESLTIRQTALVNNYCDLMICMSSGISVATSAWGLHPVPKIQYCGSLKCSTVGIANGRIDLITTDYKSKEVADAEFFNKLNEILEKIK